VALGGHRSGVEEDSGSSGTVTVVS